MAKSPGEKFCLRWNEFEKNISTSFRALREDKDFFDVTLACGNQQIQAHKVILSACSPFFKAVLKQNPHQHPLLYLKGVQYEDIIAVLNFMYHGEVNVAQEELNTFLEVAEDLKVKGLTQNNQHEQQPAKESKCLNETSNMTQKQRPHKPQLVRLNYEENRGEQEPVTSQKELHNTNTQIKTEVTSSIDTEVEDPNQMVVNNDYYEDNTGYEDYQQDYEEQQVQYETIPVNTAQDRSYSTGILALSKYINHELFQLGTKHQSHSLASIVTKASPTETL